MTMNEAIAGNKAAGELTSGQEIAEQPTAEQPIGEPPVRSQPVPSQPTPYQPVIEHPPNKLAGILRKEDIIEEMKAGRLIKEGSEENVQACSYDMTIGTIFIDKEKLTPTDKKSVTLSPGAIVSVFTKEELDLPQDIAATAFAINAMSSEGLLVLNPGHIDPGFKGPLTVRAINLRATSKAITFGTRIFTVIFDRLPAATAHPYSQNKTREEREIDFHAKDVEQNPESLFKLVTLGKDKPLMTAEEVDRRITEHMMSRAIFLGTMLSVVLALIAALFAVIAVFKDTSNKALPVVQDNANRAVESGSRMEVPSVSGGAVLNGNSGSSDNINMNKSSNKNGK
jgi:deoxycytidine triphosphate deaminase